MNADGFQSLGDLEERKQENDCLFSLQRNCCCKQSKQREDIKHSDIPATPLDSWSCDSEDNLIQPLSSKAGSNLNMNFHRICPFIPVAAFSMWLSSHWPPKR